MSDDGNPLDYPARPEVIRERARRMADLAKECGEVVPGGGPSTGATADLDTVLVKGDLDAARAFFAAAKEEQVNPTDADAPSVRAGASTLDFARYRARKIRARLLALLDTLVAAIEHRDLSTVWDVLDESDACRCFPPAVREEALVIARMPREAYRAPVRLYRYYHMLKQLGDEPLIEPPDPQQTSIDFPSNPRTPSGGHRRHSGSR